MLARWKSKFTNGMLFCGIIGALAMTVACGPKPEPPVKTKCYSDRDCAAGYYCVGQAEVQVGQDRAADPAPKCLGADGSKCGNGPTAPGYPTPAGTCELKPQPKGCYSDKDCGTNQYCDKPSGTTEPAKTCSSDSNGTRRCGLIAPPPTGVCKDRPTPPRPKSCNTDKDCGSDERCDYNQGKTNFPTPNCGGGDDDDAPSTDLPGTRVAPNCMPPAPTGVCVKKPTQTGCQADSDCAADEVCQLGKVTEPAPAPDSKCNGLRAPGSKDDEPAPKCTGAMPPAPAGVCVIIPHSTCQADSDCGKNEICDFADAPTTTEKRVSPYPARPPRIGVCRPAPKVKCTSDSECGNNQKCVKSTTGTGTGTDPDDTKEDVAPAPCAPGEKCGTGRPVAPPPTYGTCEDVITCVVTKRLADGTVCKKCSDGTSMCATPGNPAPPQP